MMGAHLHFISLRSRRIEGLQGTTVRGKHLHGLGGVEGYVLELDALGQRVTDLERSHCEYM